MQKGPALLSSSKTAPLATCGPQPSPIVYFDLDTSLIDVPGVDAHVKI
jgi:hypothetical protein